MNEQDGDGTADDVDDDYRPGARRRRAQGGTEPAQGLLERTSGGGARAVRMMGLPSDQPVRVMLGRQFLLKSFNLPSDYGSLAACGWAVYNNPLG